MKYRLTILIYSTLLNAQTTIDDNPLAKNILEVNGFQCCRLLHTLICYEKAG